MEVLSERLPVHQVGGWWTRGASVDGVPVEFSPFGILLLHLSSGVEVGKEAEDLAVGPAVNALVGPDGAWWVVAAGATDYEPWGYQRPVDLVRQGQPPDVPSGMPVRINSIFFVVCCINEGSWDGKQVASLSLGCSLLSRAYLWKGHRVITERELTGTGSDLSGLDVDDLRRQIQIDETWLESG